MTLWTIFASAFLIGFSGAMMPGPMLGVTIDGSLKKGWIVGPLVVLGHGVLELTLIIVMTFGLRDFFSNPQVAGFIGFFGGIFLAWMGYGMIKSSIEGSISLESVESKDGESDGRMGIKNPILTGILVSATNPYFILWWASTGMESIRMANVLGFAGIIFFFAGHILSDFIWYLAISLTFSKGKMIMSDSIYRLIVLLLGIFIVGFSIYFMNNSWAIIKNLFFIGL
ncbi:MAG: LysE family transporter [Clostridiales bacterium]|nr:LysE family transporter [Clostridiales bacterium]